MPNFHPGGGLALWAPIFWKLRHRIGPVTAVERQIAHIWGGSVAAVVLLFVVESLLQLPVLTLSPVLGLIGGAVFVAKAGILSGVFYLQAAAMFATALVMAELQRRGLDYGVTLYGVATSHWVFDGERVYSFGGEPAHSFNANTENVLQIGTLRRASRGDQR